jgi:hypothetical protein
MTAAARIVSLLALAATIAPALLFFNGRATLEEVKLWMLLATVVWFLTAPLWMDRN